MTALFVIIAFVVGTYLGFGVACLLIGVGDAPKPPGEENDEL